MLVSALNESECRATNISTTGRRSEMAESKFGKLTRKLQSQGKTAEQAKGIAAKAGMEKMGKEAFEAKAAAGRAKKC